MHAFVHICLCACMFDMPFSQKLHDIISGVKLTLLTWRQNEVCETYSRNSRGKTCGNRWNSAGCWVQGASLSPRPASLALKAYSPRRTRLLCRCECVPLECVANCTALVNPKLYCLLLCAQLFSSLQAGSRLPLNIANVYVQAVLPPDLLGGCTQCAWGGLQ